MIAAYRNSTLSKLYSGMMRFSDDDLEVLAPEAETTILKAAKDEEFVAIIDSFLMRHYIYFNGVRHMKAVSDSLGTNALGLVVPFDSELAKLMSEHIIALSDTGIFNLLEDNMYRRMKATPSFNTSQMTPHDNSF